MTTVLAEPVWRARRAAHERRVDALLQPHLDRRRRGAAHPVEDFLFTYYPHRPARLRRWHPGAGVVLAGAAPGEPGPGYVHHATGAVLAVDSLLAQRGPTLVWIRDLLAATAARPAQLGCFGLHEWAMVYKQPPAAVRHNSWPLRLGAAGTDAVVSTNRISCTHFDAFRFFTPPARPLNIRQPARATQHDNEQPGCLHANMDLYKWAYKLSPLVDSETVVDCFELAREIRTLDMRASPYDLTGLGYRPVPIETPAGRAEYATAQRGFAERAAPLRSRLVAAVAGALEHRPQVSQP